MNLKFGKRESSHPRSTGELKTANAAANLDSLRFFTPGLSSNSPSEFETETSETFYQVKSLLFSVLIETVDVSYLSKLKIENARAEIRDIINQTIILRNVTISSLEQDRVITEICNDVLGFGPLEPLLARDDITDIMVIGPNRTYIETGGKTQLTSVRFRDAAQLMNICQRIAGQIGRRIDESSPICDARLPDGSRVNIIGPPLALDGTCLTIRKFKRDRITLDQLVAMGSVSPEISDILKIIGRIRCNVVIIGGTGSGKTTLLNCLTQFIEKSERIVTCEDAAELQLQQSHVVRLETRPPNIEGQGEVTMHQLVKNCLRMRPERIIVGEVRGPEAFDLLQAMNTGHDGSMGTLHANSPREALYRLESLVAMARTSLPSRMIREMISSSIDVVIHTTRLRDGSRRVRAITEILGMEGDTIVTQNLATFEVTGQDGAGQITGQYYSHGGGRPRFMERAAYFGEDRRLTDALSKLDIIPLSRST